ncbi:MAG: CotH kinase family protein [Planctomycetes bacterium]|nr:CotH kinase family protein [Planctomycetota bacterium]
MRLGFVLGFCLVLLTAPTAPAQNKSPVFGLTKIHEFHLDMSAKEWGLMQKVEGGLTIFGPKKIVVKPGEEGIERHLTAGFGLAFPWASADLHADGKIYKAVGVRYKGNGSYVSTDKMLKRNLKIEVDHYDEDQRFHGVKTITLNAGAVDASRLREALAYNVFRAAGVAAPRTAFAKVTLSVPGKYNKEFVGVYTFVEHIDKAFLKEHFKNGKGLLMKPERMRGIEYFGEDWAKYKDRYRPKREPTPAESQRVIAFAKLVNKADDDAFKKAIGDYLDIDAFLRFAAVNTLLPNTDCFFTTGHNYFIYLNPKTNKLVFLPWDLDIAFAGFPAMGSVDQQATLSIQRPLGGRIKLVDRLFALPEVKEQYAKVLKDLVGHAFAKKRVLAELSAMQDALREPLAQEKKAVEARKEKRDAVSEAFAGWFAPAEMRSFVERRAMAVAKQLDEAGKVEKK